MYFLFLEKSLNPFLLSSWPDPLISLKSMSLKDAIFTSGDIEICDVDWFNIKFSTCLFQLYFSILLEFVLVFSFLL